MSGIAPRGLAQGDGIYADFNTSMGSFTCRLEYAVAPRAVANFIGLATGQRAWLDVPKGRVIANAFYNGLTFHRTVTNFVIQGGSPNGLGTDGPGYAFVDEFSPSLRHDGFGVLSMANSGPDSNGSQFFLTVTNRPDLNDVHTVFGRLVGGSNVVYAINRVPTDANEKPLTNVVIHSVNIRRVGAAAQAFDIHAQNLPVVTNLLLAISKSGANVNLTFSNRLYSDNRLYSSTNFTDWSGMKLGIEVFNPMPSIIGLGASAPSQFFRMVQVQYPDSTLAPKNVLGRTLTLNFDAGGTLIVAFDSSGTGTYTLNGTPGTVTDYDWFQDPYRGFLSPILYSGVDPMVLRLDFQTTTAGTFAGTVYLFGVIPSAVSGSFALSQP
jgi:cyclophilin family peptidyl-prolyl cis-trans isomerase